MPRGSGGASHGGGGHSGGHSFGGRSGGGSRPGGRPGSAGPGRGGMGGPRPGGPRPGGFFGPRPPRPHGPGYPPPPPRGPRHHGRPSGGCGCLSSFAALFVIILIVILASFQSCGRHYDRNYDSSEAKSVEQSATKREAVTGTTTYGTWYVDELNYIHHGGDLTDGLKYFYSKTGIQPYVLLSDYDSSFWKNGNWDEDAATAYLADVYKNTFSDNGHLIFAYFACENDSEDTVDGTFYFYYGSSAFTIMDSEAEDIFWSYFDINYDNLDLNAGEFISYSFEQTADNIMHIEKSNAPMILIIIGVILIFVLVIILLNKHLGKTKREQEQAEAEIYGDGES